MFQEGFGAAHGDNGGEVRRSGQASKVPDVARCHITADLQALGRTRKLPVVSTANCKTGPSHS